MYQVTAILIGAGLRGAKAYATYAKEYPANFRIKAVAEPNDVRRESFAKEYEISDEFCFKDYKEVLERPKFADCVLVCTQDHEHFEPVMLALRKGYHVLCEKPMSVEREEMLLMEKAAAEYDRVLSVCHVLRYSPFFKKIKSLLQEEIIGKLINIRHIVPGDQEKSDQIIANVWKVYRDTRDNEIGFETYCYRDGKSLYLACPILNDSLEEQGSLVFRLNIKTIYSLMNQVGDYRGGVCAIYTKKGNILETYPKNVDLLGKDWKEVSHNTPYIGKIGEEKYRLYNHELCMDLRVAIGIPENYIIIANLLVILMKHIKREESRIKFFGILFLIFGFGVMIISARQGSVDLIIMYMTGFGVRWN